MWNHARVLHLSQQTVSQSRTASYNRGIAATVTALSDSVCGTSCCMLQPKQRERFEWRTLSCRRGTLCWMLTHSSHDSARSVNNHVIKDLLTLRSTWESTWSSGLVGSTHTQEKSFWLSVQQLRDAATINRKWFNRFYTTAIDRTRGIPAALGLLAFISLPHRCPNPLSTAALALHQAPAWGDCINQNVERVTTSVAAVVASFWTTGGLTGNERETLCFQHSAGFGGNPA